MSSDSQLLGNKSIDGTKEKIVVIFNDNGQVIGPNKNVFNTRCLELAKTHIGITDDDWRCVPDAKKDLVFETLQDEFTFPPEEKDSILKQIDGQWKTWKKNIRSKYFGKTKEYILVHRGKVPEKVLVSLTAWNAFVDCEATTKKLNQRLKAQENRSKKTDAHYLGRTSYAEKEEKWPKDKRKPDRVELYVEARKHPKTNECHPGALSDVEKINAIRSTQDEASKRSLDTDALTQHFGKDKRGRTRGVGSTVSRTKLKATMPVRNKLEKVKDSLQSTEDKISNLQSTMNHILKMLQEKNPSTAHRSEGMANQTNMEALINQTQNCSEKLLTTPSSNMPTAEDLKKYEIMNLDGSKAIAVATIVKTPPGAIVHHCPMLPFEVKVSVFKVFPEMKNEPIWKGNQGGADTIEEFEGGFMVWPKYLMKEVVGEI